MSVGENQKALIFHGSGKEYFKIWIVNIALTVITFGIYSAWAKVRTNKYFYGNTFFGSDSFDYHADPKKILIGRIIVIAFYALFVIFNDYLLNHTVAGAIFFIFLILLPWLIKQSVRFKLKYTSFRTVHFGYHATTWQFYKFFILHGLLLIVTFGISYLFSFNSFKKLLINHASYGESKLTYSGDAGSVYGIAIISSILSTIIMLVVIMCGAIIFSMLSQYLPLSEYMTALTNVSKNPKAVPPSKAFILASVFIVYFFFIVYIIINKGFWEAKITNYVWDKTKLSDGLCSFESKLGIFSLIWIYLSNFILVIITFGLYMPWAKVRIVRYKVKNFFISCQNIDNFKGTFDNKQNALGEETADFFDMDIGF